ncbi:MAG: terpene cyclase/mutase family protein [Clostridia bacterium]|nr:terpene cyclase/mutase family protein [Clostridia bacterium]
MIKNSRFVRTAAIFMAAVMVFLCLPISSSAKTVNITSVITSTKDYVVQNKIPVNDWNDTVMYSSVGIFSLTEVEPYIPEADHTSALTTATRILASISVGQADRSEGEKNADVEALKELQNQDGSFGDFYDTLYSVMALKAFDVTFKSEKAVEVILSYLNEDGGFYYEGESPVRTTGRAMTVLSMFTADPKVTNALNKNIEFLESKKLENGLYDDGTCVTYCCAMIGLLDVGVTMIGDERVDMTSTLLEFKNSDHSFNMNLEDEESDDTATLYALTALDAVGRSDSVYARIMEKGSVNQYSLKDYIPFFTGYGILALISIVFWVYIMFFRGRNNNKKVENEI